MSWDIWFHLWRNQSLWRLKKTKTLRDVIAVPIHSTRDQVLSLWSGSTDSKTLDYQRTNNPRGYQIVRTHRKETTWIQDLAPSNHPVKDATCKQQTKQKYKPCHQQTGIPPHAALPIRRKTIKKTKTQYKSHPIQSSHKPLTNLRRTETKKKKEFNLL